MEKKEEFKIRDLEILAWFGIPLWTFYHVLTTYGVNFLRENPSMGLVFFYASFPVIFAFTMKFIYNEFPLGAVFKAITKK